MIFYFSGTGNTRWAAEQLAHATGDELIYIPDELGNSKSYQLKEGERLGFCFPTHGWQPPRIVREFIRRSTFSVQPSTYIYALTTCGDNMGYAMRILRKERGAEAAERVEGGEDLGTPAGVHDGMTDPERIRFLMLRAAAEIGVAVFEIRGKGHGVIRSSAEKRAAWRQARCPPIC